MSRRAFVFGLTAASVATKIDGCATTPTPPPGSARANGGWSDPASWPNGRVPGPGDIAVVDRHIVVSGKVVVRGIRIEPSGVLEFDSSRSTTIESAGNVVNAGRLSLRPAREGVKHRLRFTGVDERRYVGGGMSVLDSDVGLWTIDSGVLDAQGTRRTGWNRTGDDPTWLATDELVTAPHSRGDFTTFAPHRKGAAAPTIAGPGGPVATEVLNLTRNVWIEGMPDGRAHVMFLHCKKPQTIRHIGIRHMGPRQDTGATYRSGRERLPITEGVTGRYGLHFHHCGDGTRGSEIEGVVVRDGGFRGFVPHMSHGITFRDCVAYNVFDDGYWWDHEHATNDVTYERCAAMLVRSDPDFRGYSTTGFTFGEGINMVARDCVAVGVRSNSVNSAAFMWPSSANHDDNVWTVEDCVAHNNRDAGFGVWQNDGNPHVVVRPVAFHNGIGISHGAYTNRYTFRDGVVFGNGRALDQHALGSTFERMAFHGDVHIGKHSLATSVATRYVNCEFAGSIVVAEQNKAGVIQFESTDRRFDLRRDQFDVRSVLSTINVRNSDGSSFTVR